MIRSHQTFWNRMLMSGDIVTTVVAMLLAWTVRFKLGLFAASSHVPLPKIIFVFIIVSVYLANTVNGLYVPKRRETLSNELLKLIRSHLLLGIILMSLLYVLRLGEFPRSVLLIYLMVSLILTSIFRMVGRAVLRKLRASGFNQKHIILLGMKGSLDRVRSAILSYPWMGYSIDGLFVLEDDEQLRLSQGEQLRYELDNVLRRSLVDEVIIVSPGHDRDNLAKFVSVCELHGVQVSIVPDYFELLPARPRVHVFGEIPAIVARGEPLDDPFNAVAKRAFDFVFAALALLLLSPAMLVIALITKATSPGPVVFKQTRIGKGRKPFTIYKFRTMHTPEYLGKLRDQGLVVEHNDVTREVAASREGWTVENDPRRTRFGSFLRKTSLDEILQFWNVLKGDMSVIGPRPEQPKFVDEFRETVPSYMVKHHVKPGITGWAQVNGWRGDTSITERINCDLYYIENWSFAMDVKIVWLTVFKGLVNKNAY